ncbi:hypothetical protein CAPTEDRAFT_143062 [Capitella teleta]|uniref:Sodium-dependent multivitamin transporter n=1 Tax=Capitella teleta TaxID=283909 RepID=R7TYI7_CAPTE|nr:hypothetical protein CAPTEDRAFT_143062 [Capitella teleta]|eukprot:ELT96491.1 hypothetical protein CAPTEDRAFT_143062 [Capitella teleta]
MNKTFHVADYAIFLVILAISMGIGIFYARKGRKKETTATFLMADRSMSILPVSMSLLASFVSTIAILGIPSEMYIYGTQFLYAGLGFMLLVPLAAHIYLPIFYKLKLTSVFEYLEMRFNKTCRKTAAVCFIIQMLLYISIVLYAPSLAFEAVTGLNKWITVFVVGIVCTLYTSIGGIKAVMWTDAFQVLVLIAGLAAVLIKGSIDMGGMGNIWAIMEERNRTYVFDTDPRIRHTFWTMTFGNCFQWLAIYGVNQATVQRAMTSRTLRQAQLALYVNIPGWIGVVTICGLCGFVAFAEYKDCDPLEQGRIGSPDQLLPLYVMDKLYYPGLPGLFISCVFSGGLSTMSSGLNSLAAVTMEDFIKPTYFSELSEQRATLISKIITLCYGAVMVAFTFVASNLGAILQASVGLFGMIGGPVLGVFTLGIIYPWANSKAWNINSKHLLC